MAVRSPNSSARKEKVHFLSRKIRKVKCITEKVKRQSFWQWQWYEPSDKNTTVDFCQNTTLHGLQYVGQQSRHLCERLFWLVAFLAAGFAATFFIWRLYTEYLDMPIVTVFNPTETTLDKIPFPAVTICNVNNIRKSKYIEYKQKVTKKMNNKTPSWNSWNQTDYLKLLASVNDVAHICESKKTFSERFTEDIPRVELDEKIREEINAHLEDVHKLMNPKITLQKGSQTCQEMLMFCLWHDEVTNCSHLFQEIETDFGSCCVFNMIPVKLLMKSTNDNRDNATRLKAWNTTLLNYDNIMFENEHENRSFPYRQKYPGISSGLSFLVEPDLNDYDCTNTDSEGYMISLNEPLTFPKMKDSGIAVPTGSEVFISVRPEVTMFDESIRQFTLEKRRCYFGNERDLPHYTKYTAANCIADCMANRTMSECQCKPHYMPRDANNTLCPPAKYNCTEEVRRQIKQKGLNKACKCLPTCTEIEYHNEVTSLKIRSKTVANLLKKNKNIRNLNTSLSIVHVYFGVDAVYPRLRKEMMTKIDLLSNAGGLLGLCMGFSVLSVLEIIYYLTIRPFFRNLRQQMNAQHATVNVQQIGDEGTNRENIRESNGTRASSSNNDPSYSRLSHNNEIWATKVIHHTYAARFRSQSSSTTSPLDVDVFKVGRSIVGHTKKNTTEITWQK